MGRMAPRERFELPWRRPPVVRSEISFFRDHRLTGLDYLGVGYGRIVITYKSFPSSWAPGFFGIGPGCAARRDRQGREMMKSAIVFRLAMRITVETRGRTDSVEMPDGASPMDVLASLTLLPDAHIVLRGGVPIPIDERLSDGDSLRLIRVASGG